MNDSGYDLLSYSKWNRKLINLLWICNAIILSVEIIVAFRYYQTQPMPPLQNYLFEYVFIPSFLVFLLISGCELSVRLLRNNYEILQPFVITLTSVAICGVLLIVHYYVTVVFVIYAMPVFFSLVYNNKRVLLYTYIVSMLVFISIYMGYFSRANLPNFIVNVANLPANMAILFVAYLIGRTILKRQAELISIMTEAARAKSRAEAALDVRTRFLASMSHEIRTPMNGIIGLTELALGEKGISVRLEEYLIKIKSSANGLLSIINDILDISKIDAGKLSIEMIPFDLHIVFAECKAIIINKAEEKGLQLVFSNETKLTNKIIGDPTRLRQALLNLLSNAVKFTERGTVTLAAKRLNLLGRTEKAAINFEIKDTGIGISEEQLELIFEPFSQADDSTTRNFGGTGLGLSITVGIVEMMGGRVEVESVANEGSRFWFDLEFELSEEETAPEDISTNDVLYTNPPLLNGYVLVCEDNEINRQVCVENLKKTGLCVEEAENGKIALDIVRKYRAAKRSFDIILMDIHMPIMDGLQAVKELSAMGVQAPVIAMTANAMAEDRDRYLRCGMTDYLCKPFSLRELWACLLKYLKPAEKLRPVNEAIGLKYADYDMDFYRKILANFIIEQAQTPALLEKAIAEDDFELAAEVAHSEKSVALVIGAVKLHELLTDLEKAFRSGYHSRNEGLLENYKAEHNDVLKYVDCAELNQIQENVLSK